MSEVILIFNGCEIQGYFCHKSPCENIIPKKKHPKVRIRLWSKIRKDNIDFNCGKTTNIFTQRFIMINGKTYKNMLKQLDFSI